MLRKWYFATNERGIARASELIEVAVKSCQINSGLTPHCLYCGPEGPGVDWMRSLGVDVVKHTPSLEHELRQAYGEKYDTFSGHWLRCDLPLVEREEEYVLYTDIDVMFLRDVGGVRGPGSALAAAPEHDRQDFSYFSTGVLVMNMEEMRRRVGEFHSNIRKRLRTDFSYPSHDQASFNDYFHGSVEWLEPEMNWKPYWGVNPRASIVHFHGPKPGEVERLKKGDTESMKKVYKRIWERDKLAYDHYCSIFYELMGGQ